MFRRPCWLLVILTTFSFAAGGTAAGTPPELEAAGIEYRFEERTEPRPLRIHVVRVDLSKEQAEAAVVVADDPDGAGPAEAALTDPWELVRIRPVVAFINTNPWEAVPDAEGRKNTRWYEGQPVNILGFAASKGRTRSADEGRVAVWVDSSGRVSLGAAPPGGDVVEGLGGFAQIVDDGAVVVGPDEPLHPRTAIGVDEAGQVLWLVVVDGRQPKVSEGMTVHELANLMQELGCWDAANLDGGGSSVMGLADAEGYLQVINRPSGRSPQHPLGGALRPIPTLLAIQAKSGSPLAAWVLSVPPEPPAETEAETEEAPAEEEAAAVP